MSQTALTGHNPSGIGTKPKEGVSIQSVFSSMPDFAIGALFIYTWLYPRAIEKNMVASLMLVMLMEFIVIHSVGFMGNVAVSSMLKRKKVTTILGLGLFYTLFVAGFAAGFNVWWPIIAFWGLTFNRLLGLLTGQAQAGREKILLQKSWAVGALFYLLFVFVTILLPIPRLGVTRSAVHGLYLGSGGVWVSQPHRVIAFGAMYFTSLAISELISHRWLSESGLPKDKDNPFAKA